MWSAKEASRWECVKSTRQGPLCFLNDGLIMGAAMLAATLLPPVLFHHLVPSWNFFGLANVFSPLAGILCRILMWNMRDEAHRRFRSDKELHELLRK